METPVNPTHPFFSVIILCWNNSQTIQACLEAVNSQTERDFEVILIDNGSSEPIQDGLLGEFPELSVHFRRLEQNNGFAAGNNLAAGMAKGDYLALLNADAFPRPDWLEQVHGAIQKYPRCFFSSKLLMAERPDRLDGIGDVYHASGLVWRNGFNTLTAGVRDAEVEVFSACGAAAVYPRLAFLEAGKFDEAYNSYQEDVDLSFRLRYLGYRCMYIPGAVVAHVGSGSTRYRSDLSVYYGHRNLVWTFYKDMPGAWVWLLTPLHWLMNMLMVLVGLTRGQGGVMIKAKADGLKGLPAIWKKRQQVQHSRLVPVRKLVGAMDWNPISPLVKLVHR